MPFLWQPEVGNLWGMCGEPRKGFPTFQSLCTSAFREICGEWGENSKKDVTDLSLLKLASVVSSGSLGTDPTFFVPNRTGVQSLDSQYDNCSFCILIVWHRFAYMTTNVSRIAHYIAFAVYHHVVTFYIIVKSNRRSQVFRIME